MSSLNCDRGENTRCEAGKLYTFPVGRAVVLVKLGYYHYSTTGSFFESMEFTFDDGTSLYFGDVDDVNEEEDFEFSAVQPFVGFKSIEATTGEAHKVDALKLEISVECIIADLEQEKE